MRDEGGSAGTTWMALIGTHGAVPSFRVMMIR